VLALAAAALVLAGCGGAGSGNRSQGSGQEEQASKTAGSTERNEPSGGKKPDKERASEDDGRLDHPSLGSAEAVVVLTEYSDYQ